ncbi:MAG: hypothetical protein MUF87_17860 [Anaerolineae bacterium]|jgi:hypothetical protein|nr:hypothetical protein [Anaerolineae bacterium]
MSRREGLIVIMLALIGSAIIIWPVTRPTYTDSFYHYNAAERLATGQGLTDTYLWTYVGQPEPTETPVLVTPSHLYWMPLTSILSGVSMAILGVEYRHAQLPLIFCLAGAIGIAYHLGWRLGGTRRHAILAAWLTLFNAFFVPFWGEIDTFAPYALFGSGCLLALGYGLERRSVVWFAMAGVAAGLGHLTRADGLLLFLVGVMLLFNPWWYMPNTALRVPPQTRITLLIVFTVAYLAITGLWFARMIAITGSPLPIGGLQAIWFTTYNDLFRYPPDSQATEFFAHGIGLLIETRWTAITQGLQTFMAVEGLIVIAPLMLIGLWRKRGLFLAPMILFTVGIHLAMTLVFAFPGWRGGLFHAVSALIPFWMALGAVGLDAAVDWIAARRRHWRPRTAKWVFSLGILVFGLVFSLSAIRPSPSLTRPFPYDYLLEVLPPDARVMINDPAQLYYFTRIGGAVYPNEDPQVIAAIAAHYGLTHVILEGVNQDEDGRSWSGALPERLQPLLIRAPNFMTLIDQRDGVLIYQIILPPP